MKPTIAMKKNGVMRRPAMRPNIAFSWMTGVQT